MTAHAKTSSLDRGLDVLRQRIAKAGVEDRRDAHRRVTRGDNLGSTTRCVLDSLDTGRFLEDYQVDWKLRGGNCEVL